MKIAKYFTAPWCGPCRSFKPTVHEVIAEGHQIEEINVDDDQESAAKYGIMSVPVILILELDQDAKTETVADVIYGVVDKPELLRRLKA
jgi:thiol-disulfide isomerase/thioredoxin